ncbi:3-deoxy-D-manno-octulosonic acid transferase [Paucibacter sp. DJ1R-11]|uniref:3-deoxy-D-manno-octulosonic acid transferase n=1 Tax=Paucibacter sp. DJ1R-11 TaxID=2893556 RepID=UPI0021E3DA28|nr:3-deoxy-D-manno-octulosonic acid transferase [Paucibacter sp. DJ1R-11]MCV2365964.1 3-deoxy-D-manno-octulosonic acid transferase [Paucibacter sp. DJ1R-11]
MSKADTAGRSGTLGQSLALGLYGLLLQLLSPLYLLRLWRRGAAEPLYREWLGERFGFYAQPETTGGRLWLHAVSLGETRAAAALVAALRQARPDVRLLLTHSTATGREAGRELLQAGDAQAWLPYDSPGAVRRFLQHWRPGVGVLMETEIWPSLQARAEAVGLPMVLANARLSARSQRRGQRFAALLRPAARRLRLVLAQTEADADRLRASGATEVQVQGNLKFDMKVDEQLLCQGHAWRAQLGRPVLLAAVSREGEEAVLLKAWQGLPPGKPRPLLLIVPRHPQRFGEVEALLLAAGLTVARRSRWQAQPDMQALQADAWLGDSMREMHLYYGLADVALLGGSFAPLGGQNLIEAAACGCPLIMGPHTFNFAQAAELAEEAGAALRVPDLNFGLEQALRLSAEPVRRSVMQAQARAFAERHRGAAARMATAILALAPH